MDATLNKDQGRAEARYSALLSFKSSYLDRAREAALLSVPSIMPPEGSQGQKLRVPAQGLGSRGVNNLANKLLMTIFPPNSPMFRLVANADVLEDMLKAGNESVKTQVEEKLAKLERKVVELIETSGDRVSMFEALKHLIITGNVLVYAAKPGIRIYHLDKYVVKRDPEGNVLEIVTCEMVSPSVLPESIRDSVIARLKTDGDHKIAKLYTHVTRDEVSGMFRVYQEVKGVQVPESHGTYPADRSPWIALRWTKIDGEDYGRGFIEELMGDLNALEILTTAIVQGSAAAARVLVLVNPNGVTRKKTIAEAPNGAVREGKAEDVTAFQLQKQADLNVALATADRIVARLEAAFLLHSSVQRNGERVTAEEIRYMASELEGALGGVYSIFTQEFQLPYVRRRLLEANNGKKLSKELVRPAIVTGLEALGRGHDLRKLDALVAGAAETVGAQALSTELNVGDYLRRRATALGIDIDGLFKTEAQKQAEQQQAQMMTLAHKLGPEALKQVGNAQALQSKGTETSDNPQPASNG